jgi:hypothetical protein
MVAVRCRRGFQSVTLFARTDRHVDAKRREEASVRQPGVNGADGRVRYDGATMRERGQPRKELAGNRLTLLSGVFEKVFVERVEALFWVVVIVIATSARGPTLRQPLSIGRESIGYPILTSG